MGKPYGHSYFFAGDGSTCGTMICMKCSQPIFNHAHDWLAYQKSKGGDWAYHCYHRKCFDDQSGWEILEKAASAENKKTAKIEAALSELCREHGITANELKWRVEDWIND